MADKFVPDPKRLHAAKKFDVGRKSAMKYQDASKDEASIRRKRALDAYAEQQERKAQEDDPLG